MRCDGEAHANQSGHTRECIMSHASLSHVYMRFCSPLSVTYHSTSIVWRHTRTHTHTHTHVHTYTHTDPHAHPHMHTRTYAHTHTHIHAHKWVNLKLMTRAYAWHDVFVCVTWRIYRSACAYMYIYMNTYSCVYTYLYLYIHISIHIRVYIHI